MTRAQYDAVRAELDRARRYLVVLRQRQDEAGNIRVEAVRALEAVLGADAILSQAAPVVVDTEAPTRCAG